MCGNHSCDRRDSPNSEAKPSPKPQPKPEAKPSPKPQPKTEAKPSPKPQPKRGSIWGFDQISEALSPKIRPKQEARPPPKPQPKPEAKPSPKPQPKPEAKPSLKPQPKESTPQPKAKSAGLKPAEPPPLAQGGDSDDSPLSESGIPKRGSLKRAKFELTLR